MSVLDVSELSVGFASEQGILEVISDLSLSIAPGETLGLVGESGCGKSLTATAIMGLLPKPHGQILGGDIRLLGESLLTSTEAERRQHRGQDMAMVFQEPMTALNPVQPVGRQLAEIYQIHRPNWSTSQIQSRIVSNLKAVGIQDPESRLSAYPHELSGGMRQRIMIAMALSLEPKLLICDEPTTALDVTIQAQVLDLIRNLTREHGTAVLFITHDLGVIAELADRVCVMYGGQRCEERDVEALFRAPLHPYTQGLLDSIPRLDHSPRTRLQTIDGQVPQAGQFPAGCRFRQRCTRASAECEATPPFVDGVACFHPRETHHA